MFGKLEIAKSLPPPKAIKQSGSQPISYSFLRHICTLFFVNENKKEFYYPETKPIFEVKSKSEYPPKISLNSDFITLIVFSL